MGEGIDGERGVGLADGGSSDKPFEDGQGREVFGDVLLDRSANEEAPT